MTCLAPIRFCLFLSLLLGVARFAAAQNVAPEEAVGELSEVVQEEVPQPPPEMPRRVTREDPLSRFAFARSARRSRSGLARVPNMFGDDLGLAVLFAQASESLVAQPIPLGGTVRRIKVAENESAIPQDRWIFGYNFYNDPTGGIPDINQFEIGLERTFQEGNSSLQVRVPVASTLASDQLLGFPSRNETEFGNLYFLLKTVLLETDGAMLTGGCGFTLPTSDDTQLLLPGGPRILEVDNGSFHLLPYLGLLSRGHAQFFFQSFVQLDIDANGNDVSVDLTGANQSSIGVYQDPLVMYFDVGVGTWLWDDPRRRGISSMAALLELHYATTLQDADQVSVPGLAVISAGNRFDEMNLSAGLSALWNEGVTIRPALVLPLRTAFDRAFNYEVILQVNFWR